MIHTESMILAITVAQTRDVTLGDWKAEGGGGGGGGGGGSDGGGGGRGLTAQETHCTYMM